MACLYVKCVVLKCQFHILTNRVDIIYICWGIYIIIIFHKITVTYTQTRKDAFLSTKFSNLDKSQLFVMDITKI